MCLTIYGSELHEEVISILKELFDEEIVDRIKEVDRNFVDLDNY